MMVVHMQPNDLVTEKFKLAPQQRAALKRLHINTINDLLYHLPTRHVDAGKMDSIAESPDGERVSVYGQVTKVGTKKSFRSKVPMGEATIRDSSGTMKLIWFHQPYIAKMIQVGDFVRATGSISKKTAQLAMMNPEIEKVAELPGDVSPSLFVKTENTEDTPPLYPVYPESRGVTSRWFYHAIEKIFASGILDTLIDPLPKEILARYNLPSLSTALVWMHTPREEKHALSARKRFAFEEIFFIQLERQQSRHDYAHNPSFKVEPSRGDLSEFIHNFGFPLTQAQQNATDTILKDMATGNPMLRLLEGDVGSGKTAVAAATTYATVHTRPMKSDSSARQSYGALQVAYMCPTEILASQHFESFIKYFVHSGINVGLMTGSGCKKFPSKVNPGGWTDISRTQFLKWVANGEIPIVIGTHALIQKSVQFKHLAYVIIDEQHRFGTAQRAKLVQKDGRVPHLLSMTATPIPRTLALTLYGDLDLTLLDQMPSGRKPVKTEIVPKDKREDIYQQVKARLEEGRQAYVICPRIDEPDPEKELALNAKSVKVEAKRLKEQIFPNATIDILHSKMKPKEKDAVMEKFASGKIDILVATSVVEVGVNVPNATIIIIEGAERFGLAQLHQLRGRVLRGTHQAYCYLLSESFSDKTHQRLKALVTAKNGFELSEMDLALRGAGELGGGKQWGISDIGMEAIKNIKMVEAAREEAKKLLADDPDLSGHTQLQVALTHRAQSHFE
jgi:ATP-dependent DNA helicase RecG